MPSAKTVVAVTAFSAEIKGERHHVHEGERFASTHPLVAHARELFEPEDTDVKRPQRRSRA
jgi:hypothetical protein